MQLIECDLNNKLSVIYTFFYLLLFLAYNVLLKIISVVPVLLMGYSIILRFFLTFCSYMVKIKSTDLHIIFIIIYDEIFVKKFLCRQLLFTSLISNNFLLPLQNKLYLITISCD